MNAVQAPHGYSIVDKEGMETTTGVDLGTAQAMVDYYLQNDVEFGCTLRIVPSKPRPPAPPITFDLRPHFAIAPPAPKLPDVEPGEERVHLRECMVRRDEAGQACDAAKSAVGRAQMQLRAWEKEVARLRAADEAETAAAGVSIASRLKDGTAAPLEPHLGTFRRALLDAEARCDAEKRAAALVAADADAAEKALTEAETAVRLAADVVLRAELRQRVEQLNALWAQITPLRQLIDDAMNSSTPIDLAPAKQAFKVPDLKYFGDEANKRRLTNYRRALQQDADATFAAQSAEVQK